MVQEQQLKIDLRTPAARAAVRKLVVLRSTANKDPIAEDEIMDVWAVTVYSTITGVTDARLYTSYIRWGDRAVRYWSFGDGERLFAAVRAHL
jgi:hypothetical protein